MTNNDYTELLQQAEQGDAHAQFKLGFIYATGRNTNHKKAVYWWTKASEQGHEYAQINLRLIYEYGEGI